MDISCLDEIEKNNPNFYYMNFQMQSLDKYLHLAKVVCISKNGSFLPSSHSLGFVESGQLQRAISNRNGTEKISRIIGPGNMIGELCYFLKKDPTEHFIAKEDSVIRLFEQDTIENILLNDRTVSDEIIKWLCLHSVVFSAQLEESLDRDLHLKICRFLYQYFQDFGRINKNGQIVYEGELSQKEIAAYLGLNRVCVNREVKQLIDSGILEKTNNKWTVLDKQYFEKL